MTLVDDLRDVRLFQRVSNSKKIVANFQFSHVSEFFWMFSDRSNELSDDIVKSDSVNDAVLPFLLGLLAELIPFKKCGREDALYQRIHSELLQSVDETVRLKPKWDGSELDC